MIGRVVNETVFPKKQFFAFDMELDVEGKLAEEVLEAMHLEKSHWQVIKNKVRRKLNKRRNNAQLAVRKSLTSK